MKKLASPLSVGRAQSSTVTDAGRRFQLGVQQGKRWQWLLLLWVLGMFLATSLPTALSKVYIVHMNGCAAAYYNGEISGYPATAPPHKAKMDCTSSAVHKYREYIRASHDELLESMFPEGGYSKLYSYSVVLNAFAVDIPEDKVEILTAHPDVTQMEPDMRVSTRTTYTPEYLGLPAGGWAGNGGVSNAGEDVVIGVVDTGINPSHPSFANDNHSKPYGPLTSYTGFCEVTPDFPAGSCNHKLIGARHFSAALEAQIYFNESGDFLSPLDASGHGTHTSSTAGGNSGVPVVVDGLYFGQASGMAPRARIAMYKALYAIFGGTFADIAAAIEQAVADGVDILNLSLGPGLPPNENPLYFNALEVALLGAVKANIFVVQAVGNSGALPQTSLSYSPWIVSVAASYIDRNYTNTITLGDGAVLQGSGIAAGTQGDGFYPIVMAEEVNVTNNPNISVTACQRSLYYDRRLVEGKILVCVYGFGYAFGIFSTETALETAKNLSAAGVIFLASAEIQDALELPALLGHQRIPAILITSSKAVNKFLDYYDIKKNDPVEGDHHKDFGEPLGKLNGGSQATFTGKPPTVVYFSSRGPDYDNISFIPSDVLKPNIMAPGVSIWAGWSPIAKEDITFEGENFAIVSGTSMAAPHIAGIAALIKEKHPTYSPAAIHSALAGTAYSFTEAWGPLLAEYYNENYTLYLAPATPYDLGSGQVNARDALDPGLVFEAGIDDYRKFLCLTPAAKPTQVLNATGAGCPKHLSGYQSDLNAPYVAVGVLSSYREIPRTVTSVAEIEESFTVELQSPPNVTSSIEPTSFTIAPGFSQLLTVSLTPQVTTNVSAFGRIIFRGSYGHYISIPISVAELIVS